MTHETEEERKRRLAREATARYRAKKKAEDPDAWSKYTTEASKRAQERKPVDLNVQRKRTRESSAKAREKVRAFLRAYKIEQGCIDCGYNAHHAALELDHIQPIGIKGRRASTIFNMERLQEELKLCVVRCSNCHSIRHFNEKTNAGRPIKD